MKFSDMLKENELFKAASADDTASRQKEWDARQKQKNMESKKEFEKLYGPLHVDDVIEIGKFIGDRDDAEADWSKQYTTGNPYIAYLITDISDEQHGMKMLTYTPAFDTMFYSSTSNPDNKTDYTGLKNLIDFFYGTRTIAIIHPDDERYSYYADKIKNSKYRGIVDESEELFKAASSVDIDKRKVEMADRIKAQAEEIIGGKIQSGDIVLMDPVGIKGVRWSESTEYYGVVVEDAYDGRGPFVRYHRQGEGALGGNYDMEYLVYGQWVIYDHNQNKIIETLTKPESIRIYDRILARYKEQVEYQSGSKNKKINGFAIIRTGVVVEREELFKAASQEDHDKRLKQYYDDMNDKVEDMFGLRIEAGNYIKKSVSFYGLITYDEIVSFNENPNMRGYYEYIRRWDSRWKDGSPSEFEGKVYYSAGPIDNFINYEYDQYHIKIDLEIMKPEWAERDIAELKKKQSQSPSVAMKESEELFKPASVIDIEDRKHEYMLDRKRKFIDAVGMEPKVGRYYILDAINRDFGWKNWNKITAVLDDSFTAIEVAKINVSGKTPSDKSRNKFEDNNGKIKNIRYVDVWDMWMAAGENSKDVYPFTQRTIVEADVAEADIKDIIDKYIPS